MMFADEPPAIIAGASDTPPRVVVISHETGSEVLISKDTPLPLIRAGRAEDAVLRQVIFLTISRTVLRPAAGTGEDVLRWTYEPYLQSRLCVTSITGQFTCAAAEVEDLTEKAAGEAPLGVTPDQATPGSNPTAETARIAVAKALRNRAAALFDDDRRTKLDPMLKAAGVSIRRPPVRPVPKS